MTSASQRLINRSLWAFLRLYVCSGTLITVAIACFDAGSLNHRILLAHGLPAYILLAGGAAMASLGLVDSLINDVLPERYSFLAAMRWRHLIYLTLAIGEAALLYLSMRNQNSLLQLRLLHQIVGTATLAMFDLLERHTPIRSAQSRTRATDQPQQA